MTPACRSIELGTFRRGDQNYRRSWNPFSEGPLPIQVVDIHPEDKFEGTGVGLAIVKLIMDKHGGRVWVESSPGKGSVFYLSFPLRPPS